MFNNLKLDNKLYVSFAVILLFTIFTGAFAVVNLLNLSGSMTVPAVILLILLAADIILGIIIAITVKNSISASLLEFTEKIRQGGEQIVSASTQLSSASRQLAEANTEQASSLQEISSTIEETSSMIQQNSENTKQADILAGQTKNTADICNADMEEMIASMDEIKKSSDQIARIIKTIDEIAFQTNILALNAAVEAARAGEAGMGFAVVAEEVRNLAQRSAQAAKDTETMIENNISLSGKGVEVAAKVADAIAAITTQTKKVNELMDEITAASQEQAQGMIQINKAITQLDKVTEENAAIAEESAASSEELNAQSKATEDMVDELYFFINGGKMSFARSGGYAAPAKTGGSRPLYKADQINRAGGLKPRNIRMERPDEIIPLEEADVDF
ncbi:MAG: methyl-accepting chemotaxis protein [Syntrophomonadaceae bacterium]|nr:methyl-accepting chemotaxis protein [Syntrophomonadaceae bacterium]